MNGSDQMKWSRGNISLDGQLLPGLMMHFTVFFQYPKKECHSLILILLTHLSALQTISHVLDYVTDHVKHFIL